MQWFGAISTPFNCTKHQEDVEGLAADRAMNHQLCSCVSKIQAVSDSLQGRSTSQIKRRTINETLEPLQSFAAHFSPSLFVWLGFLLQKSKLTMMKRDEIRSPRTPFVPRKKRMDLPRQVLGTAMQIRSRPTPQDVDLSCLKLGLHFQVLLSVLADHYLWLFQAFERVKTQNIQPQFQKKKSKE